MAAKRIRDDPGLDSDQPAQKKIKSRASFASLTGEVVMMNSLQQFCSALEPVLRKVVNEEFERGLRQRIGHLPMSPSNRIEPARDSSLRLIFCEKLMQPIFTGSKITDTNGNPLRVMIVDSERDPNAPVNLQGPIKLDVVALHGEFPGGENWTSEGFASRVLKERDGKRPLLAGEVNITVKNGAAAMIGEIAFTDNSSWIRGRKFRIGVKISQGKNTHGFRIKEGFTEAFIVRDHRGELYKKHHPPMLEDEVWRLEKIGKEGAFHRKLSKDNIKTVQDFLKLSVVDQARLRRILGQGMSEKMWEVTIKHAWECVMGNKYYRMRGPSFVAIFNPVCQLVKVVIGGHVLQTRDITNINKEYIQNLIRQAYANWTSLEETQGAELNDHPPLTRGMQGDTVDEQFIEDYHHHHLDHDHHDRCHQHQNMLKSIADWEMIGSGYITTPLELEFRFSIADSSKGNGNEEEEDESNLGFFNYRGIM